MTEVNTFKKKIIDLNTNIFSIGSCFSIEIKKYFKKRGFYVYSNPFGTMYNTYSIYNCLKRIIELSYYTEHEINSYNNRYFSFDHYTIYDSNNINNCLNKINENIKESNNYIKKCNLFIITLGTSIVYLYNNKIVANCHKIPEKKFTKKTLSVEENVLHLQNIITLLKNNIKNCIIIFTLSPIRHNIKDLTLNCYSKSILRVAIESLINNEDLLYFPSFEIVMDELRDYSYYKNDETHLKKNCVSTIFERFIDTYFIDSATEYIKKFYEVYKNYKHKPNNKDEIYFNFLENNLKRLNELQKIRNDKILENMKLKIINKIIKYFYTREIFTKLNPYIDEKYKDLFSSIFNLEGQNLKNNKILTRIAKSIFLKENNF